MSLTSVFLAVLKECMFFVCRYHISFYLYHCGLLTTGVLHVGDCENPVKLEIWVVNL